MDINKKVFVSDYDQTFYLNDEDIEKNKKAINVFREKGNLFIIATGRSYFDFNNKKDLYNIKYDYVIINHGATILDSNNNVICNYAIDNNVISNLVNDLEIDKVIKTFCCSKLESRVDFDYKDLTKIYVKYDDNKTAVRINNKIKEKYKEYVNSYMINENTIEIISNKTNKALSIDLLIKDININKNNVYTIGDGYSDIEMIKKFNGYCMKNSVPELKELAIKEVDSVSVLVNELLKGRYSIQK